MSNNDERYCIALHPVCDRHFHHIGDELLYRASGGAKQAVFSDPLVATARAASTAFYEIGLQSLVGKRLLFLNISEEWLQAEELLRLPPEQVVIDLPDTLELQGESLERLESLKREGFTLAISDQLADRLGDQVLALADIVRVDTRRPQAFEHLDRYVGTGRRLLAAFVETHEMLERSLAAPFDYLQGYFYSLPHLVEPPSAERKSNASAGRRLLKELFIQEPDVGRLETLLAQDPHLCAMLFRQLNSASLHSGQQGGKQGKQLSSISQAIMMLGFDKIRALTATLLLADNQPIKRMLVFKALVRADLARRLSPRIPSLNADSAFAMGLFSMIDQVEGVPLAQLVEELGLSEDIAQALLERGGDLGKVLKLIEAFEQARLEKQTVRAVETLNREYLESVAWAQEVLSFAEQ